MSKTVWILNHYAGNMYINSGGRHYYLAKYLKQNGFHPVIFCSNYDHFTHKYCIENDTLWSEKSEQDTCVKYVFVKTREYSDNGLQRILNMYDFYRGILKIAKEYADINGKPDIIYASSVHPLTLVAGIRLAKKFGIKCISEVRDLWPESIIAYSTKWTRKNPLMKVLYAGEKWIYKKSDYVIMTWPGGYDYIQEQGWEKVIPESKVVHISNGVDLTSYFENIHCHPYYASDLNNFDTKTFVYTGSVRKVNNLDLLVSAAEILKNKANKTAKLVIFGDGDELEELNNKVREKGLDNIVFKGRVSKQYIPSILMQCYATILHNSSTSLDKYGQSQNKFFEYLAASKPILMTYSVGHSVIKEYGCGMELGVQTPESIAEAISELCNLSNEQYHTYCDAARKCSEWFDYKVLCNQLISLFNKCNLK